MEPPQPKGKSALTEYLQALAIALIVALILRLFVVQAFRIPTGSMKDTLLVGDFLLVNKFIYGARTPEGIAGTSLKLPSLRLPAVRQPQRGDIVIFKFPNDTSIDYIKRCVGLPGDTIQVRTNTVYINGKPEGEEHFLQEKFDPEEQATFRYYRVHAPDLQYTIRKRLKKPAAQNYGPVVVPPDHLFMMGDNRDNSSDSRFWGFVPMEYVGGRAMFIYFSFDTVKWRLRHIPQAVRWHRLFHVIR
ncbi:signal peptidase I [candidate division KSB1 bacterium]|nr:signal peptidase I [candidate division KSB1 bacterium]